MHHISYVYIYIYIYVCIYTYISIHHTQRDINAYVYIYNYIYTYAWIVTKGSDSWNAPRFHGFSQGHHLHCFQLCCARLTCSWCLNVPWRPEGTWKSPRTKGEFLYNSVILFSWCISGLCNLCM